uniref:Uncharacterized protein n=1 Tax=Helianthus annuus TaxID=4232 RepID=A0A251TMA1_HELAN
MLRVFQSFISVLHCSRLFFSIFKSSIFICIHKIEQDFAVLNSEYVVSYYGWGS